jgi:hypothetical protein
VKQIRKRLTYANVMSSIAVFLVLGGATAFAASKIGTSQIKANAVTTGKIKKEAITTAKIKNNAVTGAKIKLESLGTVPSAGSANNANTVGGRNVKQIFAKLPVAGAPSVIFSAVGFNIVANCNGAGNPEIQLAPQTQESDIGAMGNGTPKGVFFEREQGATPTPINLNGENERGTVTFSAAQSSGAVLAGTLGFDDTSSFKGETVCAVYGQVIY